MIEEENRHILEPVKDFKQVLDFYILCENSVLAQYDTLMDLIRQKEDHIVMDYDEEGLDDFGNFDLQGK